MGKLKIQLFVAFFVGAFVIFSAIEAESARAYSDTVQVIAGKVETLDLKDDVADILIANPSVADVGTLRSDRIYIVGRAVGETNILAYDEFGNQLANINVHVRVDDKNIQDTLKAFFPNEDIKAKTVKNNIVLTGTISNPSVSNQVRDLASRFLTGNNQTIVDLMTVKGEQQVMLQVRMLEADRSLLRELGLTHSLNANAAGAVERGFGFGTNAIGATALTPFGAGVLRLGNNKSWGPLTSRIEGLEKNGLVNVLAEPNLTAISGETAGFLAGGEFPIPVGRDSQGRVTIEFKQFGVSLNFTPTVLSEDRIMLNLLTEVSERDSNNSITLVDTKIDGLRVRRAETTVELGSGTTIMIAGLIKSDTVDSINGFPGLQNIPVLGKLFQSQSFRRNESELLIMVTPYLVKPYSDVAAMVENADPSELEARLDKLIDAKKRPAMAIIKDNADVKTTYNSPASLEGASRTMTVPEAEAVKMWGGKNQPEPKKIENIKKVKDTYNSGLKPASRRIDFVDGRGNNDNLLAENLINELKNIYGRHVPDYKNINDIKLGYIID